MAKQDSFAGIKIPRSPVYGMNSMVVSGHSQASISGLRALERGGSLVDAMIATSATLSVVLPHATSLGGDAFILFHDAKEGLTPMDIFMASQDPFISFARGFLRGLGIVAKMVLFCVIFAVTFMLVASVIY